MGNYYHKKRNFSIENLTKKYTKTVDINSFIEELIT